MREVIAVIEANGEKVGFVEKRDNPEEYWFWIDRNGKMEVFGRVNFFDEDIRELAEEQIGKTLSKPVSVVLISPFDLEEYQSQAWMLDDIFIRSIQGSGDV